jgi:hypothetical protein
LHKASRFGDVLLDAAKVIFEAHSDATCASDEQQRQKRKYLAVAFRRPKAGSLLRRRYGHEAEASM